VLIRAFKGGLVLQSMFYANEIRDLSEISKGEGVKLTAEEFELANGLVEKLSSESFEPEAYEDEYQNRVRAMLDSKVKGREITVPPSAPAPRPHHQPDGSSKREYENGSAREEKNRTEKTTKSMNHIRS
jgi:DNA end-binding protein Ku